MVLKAPSTLTASSQVNAANAATPTFVLCPNKMCLGKILLINKIFAFPTHQPANQLVT